MIWKLTSQQIVRHWDKIAYAAVEANPHAEKKKALFLRKLLVNLLVGKAHCYAGKTVSGELNTLCLVRIQTDIGDLPNVLLDTVYGYSPATEEQKAEFMAEMETVAKNLQAGHIVAYSSNPMAVNAMAKVGMKKVFNFFAKEVTL